MTTLLSINNYNYPRGGAETVFLEQGRLFELHGWKVVPFCMQHPRNLPSPWSNYFVDEIEFGAEYSFAQKLTRAPKVIYSFEARRKIAALLDRVRPDVCHAHNIYNHISPSILSMLRARGVPTVLTLHDLKIACPAYQMLASDGICERCKGGRLHNVVVHRCIKNSVALSGVVWLEAVLHRMLDTYRRNVQAFAVPSRFYIDKLVEWGVPREMLVHVPNFVDVAALQPEFEPGESFLYFGRVAPEKGVPTLVRAAARAGVPLTVVGTGPQLEEMQALVASLGANVQFRGYLTGEPLRAAVRAARAIVLPSEWYENAPMSLLEAYGLGKPVIGANIGGIPELVRPGETGDVFVSGNVEALADVLGRVATMPNAALAEWGQAGRQWMEESFTPARYRERLLALYARIGVRVAA